MSQKLSAPAKAESAAKRVLVDLNKTVQDLQKEMRSTETTASMTLDQDLAMQSHTSSNVHLVVLLIFERMTLQQ